MKLGLILILLSSLSIVAYAADGVLRDPTRPADASESSVETETAARVFHLDLVIRPVSGKPSVVINGETFKLGEKVQEMKLISIRESSVVLQGPDGKEILTLVPGVEKTMRQTQSNRVARGQKPGGGM